MFSIQSCDHAVRQRNVKQINMNFPNLIFPLPQEQRTLFRNLEKVKTKVIQCKSSIIFNDTCLKENILPTYSHIRLHDQAAQRQNFTLEYRNNLVKYVVITIFERFLLH